MKSFVKAAISVLQGTALCAAVVFATAGTFDYWQAWVFLAVVSVCGWITSGYFLYTNPSVLQRRLPAAETRSLQRLVVVAVFVLWAAMLTVSALDHRFGWSAVPAPISWAGNVLVATGMGLVGVVLVQNSHAAVTVRVAAGQHLVSDGLYGLVRHPMYTCNTLLLVGTPLALGSYWGITLLGPGLAIFALRIRDEEELLQSELEGYREYMQQVRHRLIPGIW